MKDIKKGLLSFDTKKFSKDVAKLVRSDGYECDEKWIENYVIGMRKALVGK